MIGADTFALCLEDQLLSLVQDTTQRLHALLHSERSRDAGGPGLALTQASAHPLGHEDSASVLKKLFRLFREWSVLHVQRVSSLREELSTAASVLTECGARAAPVGASRESCLREHAHITDAVLNVLEDVQSMENTLLSVQSKLNRVISALSGARPDSEEDYKKRKGECLVMPPAAAPLGVLPSAPQHSDLLDPSNISRLKRLDLSVPQSIPTTTADSCASGEGQTRPRTLTGTCEPSACVPQRVSKREEEDVEEVQGLRTDTQEPDEEGGGAEKAGEGEERGREAEEPTEAVEGTETVDVGWGTLGLPDSVSAFSSAPAVCYLTGPLHLAKLITCKVVDGLSSLMVSGSEELVSSVLKFEVSSGTKCPFPLTIALPFRACYRGSYREVTVKVVDRERRISYVTPVATENIYGGHRGSFAVVRVYTLGVFAVLSRLQKEMFTVPKRGLSLKLCMEPRLCLDYLPGTFTTPVVAQVVVQPVDAMLVSTLKSRNDSYLSVLTTSPLLYLNHPSAQSPLRPLTITLPCAPNPDKNTGGDSTHPSSTALASNTLSPHRVRVLNASLKSTKERYKEQLAVLGWKDDQWNVLDKVSVRNLQNGLVCFELMENYERLLVLRLLSHTRPPYLSSFAEELEEAVRIYTVTITLHTKQHDPAGVVLAALPSRELICGLAELQAQAYGRPPEPSPEISMREGEQLLLKFNGNIASTGDQDTVPHTITFHSQRRNRLYLQLEVLDPFGNYSSPHYKGTAILFRVPRAQLVWRGDRAVISEDYCSEDPVCKLSLTLRKTVKTLPRPLSAKVLRRDQADPLCDELLSWLCGELCEEDAALLATCLHLRRSAVQLARLRAPDSLALRTFHMLTAWRRALPSSAPKWPSLARCLRRIGRPELAVELLRKGLPTEEQRSVGEWQTEEARLSTQPSITLEMRRDRMRNTCDCVQLANLDC